MKNLKDIENCLDNYLNSIKENLQEIDIKIKKELSESKGEITEILGLLFAKHNLYTGQKMAFEKIKREINK